MKIEDKFRNAHKIIVEQQIQIYETELEKIADEETDESFGRFEVFCRVINDLNKMKKLF